MLTSAIQEGLDPALLQAMLNPPQIEVGGWYVEDTPANILDWQQMAGGEHREEARDVRVLVVTSKTHNQVTAKVYRKKPATTDLV